MDNRLAPQAIAMHPVLAKSQGLQDGDRVKISTAGWEFENDLIVDSQLPEDVALVTRSNGLPVHAPIVCSGSASGLNTGSLKESLIHECSFNLGMDHKILNHDFGINGWFCLCHPLRTPLSGKDPIPVSDLTVLASLDYCSLSLTQ